MPCDYTKIRKDNIRKYGEEIRHLSFFNRLYTDRTHFIFELLQNAEDAGASKVLFQLFENKLEVLHDGRLFDEKDVRGICGVGEGTKAEDLTQIGKFGIGFKSVYAVTATPEIHSGHESFKIEHYVRPYVVRQRDIGDSWTTLFAFPFDKEDVEPATACSEISAGLRQLSARTLLFLRNIQEIEYTLPDGIDGFYLREETSRGGAREITVIGQNSGEEASEDWLIFERPVEVPDPREDGPSQVLVEIAFRVGTFEKENRVKIIKVKESPLVVYFPTEKETRLGFLIQGPYKTTPARDNIPEKDNWNATLVRETACLIADVLPQLKDIGLLDVSLLEALPIKTDDFSPGNMFRPIFDSVREAFVTKELLPADDGSFISAEKAKLASADWLRKLLGQKQLKLLFQKELKWLHADLTKGVWYERYLLRKYIREELKIAEVTPESFARTVDSAFLKNQSDQWMIDFYEQLSKQEALWKKGSDLSKKPFIRLQDGSHVRPFDDDDRPNAYLPAETFIDSQLPTVKAEIASQDKARQFLLSNLKIPEFDIVAEVIEHVIPKYTLPTVPSIEERRRDIEKIIEAFRTDSHEKHTRLMNALQASPFILSRSSISGDEAYRKPGTLYFQDPTLEMYFTGNPEIGFISSIYQGSVLDMFSKLGVSREVRITKRKPDYRDFIIICDYRGWHKRGLLGFDPDINVEGLANALAEPTLKKSIFIWNKIAIPNASCVRGTVEESNKKTYENSDKYECISEHFGRLLTKSKWLPGSDGQLHCPDELTLNELPDDFERNEKLADLLGMKKNLVAKLAEEANVRPETLKLAQELESYPDILNTIQEQLQKKKGTEFPSQTIADIDRRTKKIIDDLGDSRVKQSEPRTRTVRVSEATNFVRTWLQNQYTNKDEQMICQICKDEMPFRKRDGQYYYEAVEAFLRDHFPKEHESQFLALCPLCAAMYKEFIKKDAMAMTELRKALLKLDMNSLEAPLQLGDLKTTIQFVATHAHDIKTILNNNIEKPAAS